MSLNSAVKKTQEIDKKLAGKPLAYVYTHIALVFKRFHALCVCIDLTF